jgi:hypothetical protein
VAGVLMKNAGIDSCHLGVELRTPKPGDGGGNRSAINDATTQVLRGTNGLIDHLFGKAAPLPSQGVALFLPVIFTTATICVASGDLGAADIATGELPKDWSHVQEVPWIWYTYNQSPALRHEIPSLARLDLFDLAAFLSSESARTIAVVGSGGVEPFLTADLASWF